MLEKLPGKTIILGVLDLSTHEIETPETGRRAHPQGAAACAGRERWSSRPIAGSNISRATVAFGKMKAMAEGAAIVRAELS